MSPRNFILLFLCCVLFIIPACSGRYLSTPSTPPERIENARTALEEERIDYYRLTNEGDGGPGSFFIIDDNGIILWHPEPVLIGVSFARYGFMKEVLLLKNGCVSGGAEGAGFIYFRELSRGNILCLSILKIDYPGFNFDCR